MEKANTPNVLGLGFTNGSKLLKWLWIDHSQPDYADYSAISVIQSILDVSGTLDAHSDVRKFGGNCNTVSILLTGASIPT